LRLPDAVDRRDDVEPHLPALLLTPAQHLALANRGWRSTKSGSGCTRTHFKRSPPGAGVSGAERDYFPKFNNAAAWGRFLDRIAAAFGSL
jgi:hypothetical protein